MRILKSHFTEHDFLLSSIAGIMKGAEFRHSQYGRPASRVQDIVDLNLPDIYDVDFLRRFNDVVEMLIDPQDSEKSDFHFLLSVAERSEWDLIDILHLHLETAMRKPGNLHSIIKLHHALTMKPKLDPQAIVPTMAAHLHAMFSLRYPDAQDYRYYLNSRKIMLAVQRSPDKFAALDSYLRERGYKSFNEVQFRKSLQQGVLGEGWL